MNGPNGHVVLPRLSRRAESLGTENAFVVLAEVNALVRAGRDVVSFCIGQPDFPTPEHVQEAAIAAIRAGRHGYTPSAGIDELRAAAAAEVAAGLAEAEAAPAADPATLLDGVYASPLPSHARPTV